jgi:hypothetical protein
MVPVGIRTESPLHFSVKNMVPSFMNAMSQGESILSTKSSVETIGAAANKLPDRAKPMEAANAFLIICAMSRVSCSIGELAEDGVRSIRPLTKYQPGTPAEAFALKIRPQMTRPNKSRIPAPNQGRSDAVCLCRKAGGSAYAKQFKPLRRMAKPRRTILGSLVHSSRQAVKTDSQGGWLHMKPSHWPSPS